MYIASTLNWLVTKTLKTMFSKNFQRCNMGCCSMHPFLNIFWSVFPSLVRNFMLKVINKLFDLWLQCMINLLTYLLNRKPNHPTDMHTHTGSASDNCVTFSFDLFISGSIHAEQLPCTVRLPRLVLIAQTIFLLDCGHTDTQLQVPLITLLMYWIPPEWVNITHKVPYQQDQHTNEWQLACHIHRQAFHCSIISVLLNKFYNSSTKTVCYAKIKPNYSIKLGQTDSKANGKITKHDSIILEMLLTKNDLWMS